MTRRSSVMLFSIALLALFLACSSDDTPDSMLDHLTSTDKDWTPLGQLPPDGLVKTEPVGGYQLSIPRGWIAWPKDEIREIMEAEPWSQFSMDFGSWFRPIPKNSPMADKEFRVVSLRVADASAQAKLSAAERFRFMRKLLHDDDAEALLLSKEPLVLERGRIGNMAGYRSTIRGLSLRSGLVLTRRTYLLWDSGKLVEVTILTDLPEEHPYFADYDDLFRRLHRSPAGPQIPSEG